MRPEIIIVNIFITGVFSYIYFRLFKLSIANAFYLLLLPLVIFTPTIYLTIILLLSFFLIMISSRSLIFLIGVIIIILGIFTAYKPKIDFYYDLGTINTINAQRGEDISVLKNVKLATLLSNKTTLSFVILNHFDAAFSPVRLFAAAPYPNVVKDYPLSLLFPWDFFILLFLIGHFKVTKKIVPVLIGIFLMLVLPLLSSNEVVRFIMSGTLAYFLAFIVAKEFKLSKAVQYYWLAPMLIFDLLHLLTIIPFILKA